MKYSTLERTRKVNPPCWGEFGYKKQFRCNRCDHTFTERELIEANRNHRGDTDYCPNCSVLEDWSENETVKARVIRRWSIKPKHMESAA